MNHEQVLNVINLGIVVIDSRYTIVQWNKWMEIQSRKTEKEMIGKIIFNQYPHLSVPSFLRSCKAVLNFGNYVFYSQKLHNYLFPFKPTGFHLEYFEYMQQSCTMAPLRNDRGEIEFIVITVADVTENVYMERFLKILTQQDSLTRTFNRRYLDSRLEEEFLRYKRKGSFFSLLMIDLDDFKRVNDNYGHQFGDYVLKKMSQLCKNIIRGSDILARYGGEEFSIILPDTQKEGAMIFADRLRKIIADEIFLLENKEPVRITISIGVSQMNESITSPAILVDLADKALYESKKKGKNCVSFFEKDKGDSTFQQDNNILGTEN